MKTIYNCIVCDKGLSGKQRSYCSLRCKNEYFLNYKTLKTRAIERKRTLLKTLGSGCNKCGYSGSISSLSFYDETGETLHINTNVLANSNLKNLKNKLIGAQVLCKNCLSEIDDTGYSLGPDTKLSPDGKMIERNFIKNTGILGIKTNDIVVLGVSGGIDSIVMLDLFASIFLKKQLVVAHLNHGLREESDKDEMFVKQLAKKYGVKFTGEKIKPHSSGNLEEYFRDQRRKFLLNTAENYGAKHIALAHNANDQAETMLMNLVRGSGSAGLGAMDMCENTIVRPLLDSGRDEILGYAKSKKLVWHEDTTNKDIRYSRNYIRHNILPLLKRLNPEYLANIGRSANTQREIDGFIKDSAKKWQMENGNVNAKLLRDLQKPVLFEILAEKYENIKGDRKNLSQTHLNSVRELISSSNGTKSINLPGGIVAIRTYDKLDFCAEIEDNITSTQGIFSLSELEKYNEYFRLGKKTPGKIKVDNFCLIADEKYFKTLKVRSVRPGDSIDKRGINGNKKLQDLFVDAKISRARRQRWPIVTDEKERIIWVPGLAKSRSISETYKKPIIIKISEVANEKNEEK